MKGNNKYLEKFFNMRMSKYFKELYPELYYRKKSEKETTEAFSVIKHIKNLIIKSPENYVVIDVCSGIGYFTALASLRFPKTEFIAVDKTDDYILKDFKVPNAKRVKFDIYSAEFENFIKSQSKNVLLVGIHLCGKLSERFIELGNIDNVKAMFLMPCCIGDFNKSKFNFLAETEDYRYNSWVLYLINKIDENTFKIVSYKDKNVLSPKNVLICANKK